jgi:hypothetical protein
MKLAFLHTDLDDTRRAAEAALLQTETKIADLERDRAAKLLEDNYAGGVEQIDRQIEAQQRAATVHRDRIAAMVAKRHVEARARLERERANGIVEIGKRLAHRDTAAQRLEVALKAVRDAYTELSAADAAAFTGWPSVLPTSNSLSYLAIDGMQAFCKKPRGLHDFESRTIIGPVRSIVDGAADGLAEEIQQKGRDLIEMLQAESIPEPETSDDETEAAA